MLVLRMEKNEERRDERIRNAGRKDKKRRTMEFRTVVDIAAAPFRIEPLERMLFVGSCFAESIGRRLEEERFDVTVNPHGVMYNPASVLHSIERYTGEPPQTAVLTFGTNHVYIERATEEIVDNCRKRPHALFREEELSVDECFRYIDRAVVALQKSNAGVKIILTVSPIRYAKYGYHGSNLSKAVLLLAVDRAAKAHPENTYYFPAYELLMDELRDYRFYASDMLHPSAQAVDYVWERFAERLLSERARRWLDEWAPVKKALAHRPFNAESDEYRAFIAEARRRADAITEKYRNR